MSATTVRLWLVRETPAARLYSKLPPEKNPQSTDTVWIPRSLIEHCSKDGSEHQVKLPDWFVEKRNL